MIFPRLVHSSLFSPFLKVCFPFPHLSRVSVLRPLKTLSLPRIVRSFVLPVWVDLTRSPFKRDIRVEEGSRQQCRCSLRTPQYLVENEKKVSRSLLPRSLGTDSVSLCLCLGVRDPPRPQWIRVVLLYSERFSTKRSLSVPLLSVIVNDSLNGTGLENIRKVCVLG